MATLDQVSAGRIGWNAVTGSSDFAAMNFGLPGMPEHDLRYDMADEYMEVVQRAVGVVGARRDHRRPRTAASWSIRTKVHAVNHEGRFFKTRGPLNSGPAPQGQPVIAQAGGSPRGRQFAAQHADTIVAHTKGIAGDEGLPRRRARAHGGAAAAIRTTARCCSWSRRSSARPRRRRRRSKRHARRARRGDDRRSGWRISAR